MDTSTEVIRTQLESVEPVLQHLDLEMEQLDFDPQVPASVEAAKDRVHQVIDHLMGRYRQHPILGPLARQLKAQYLESIRARILEARRAA